MGSCCVYAGIANYEKSNESRYANVTYDLNTAVKVAGEYQHLKTDMAIRRAWVRCPSGHRRVRDKQHKIRNNR